MSHTSGWYAEHDHQIYKEIFKRCNRLLLLFSDGYCNRPVT